MTKKSDKSSVESDENGNRPILIKKYPNRRLYNTETSSYIVLDDVVKLIQSGALFVIEDTKTGEDITRSILNQIIFEQETKPANFHFPLEFQKQLISMYGDTYGKMVPDYLTESLKLFAAERSQMGQTLESVVTQNTQAMFDYSQKLARQNMELFRKSWSMFGMMGTSSNTSDDDDAQVSDSGKNGAEEAQEIESQIEALQERLKSLKS